MRTIVAICILFGMIGCGRGCRPEERWAKEVCGKVVEIGTCTQDHRSYRNRPQCSVTIESDRAAVVRAPTSVGHEYCRYRNQYDETKWERAELKP